MPIPEGLTTETYTPDKLVAGEFPMVRKDVTLLLGQNVTRGTVLGRVTASGKFVKSLSASADGSQVPCAIALEDCDATAADKKIPVALTGEFNKLALTLGAGHTLASIEWGLADKNIYLRDTVAAS